MPTNTYVALDKVTVGTATAAVTFSSISSAYTDLVVVFNGTGTTANNVYLQFNGDTANNYSMTYLYGSGTAASSGRTSNTANIYAMGLPTSNSTLTMTVMNYSNTTTYKTCLQRGAESAVTATVGLWRSTAAINSVTLKTDTSFAVGSTFSLYGIKADTNSTPKATGGFVSSDATYWYHTFAMSGTFTPSASLTCDVLTVAGGASGSGIYVGGGGGAGGVVYNAAASLSATGYTVTVGAGGAANATNVDGGNAGGNTTFGALTTAYGGGTGGRFNNVAGQSGGSGGGAGNGTNPGSATQGTSSITYAAYGNSGGTGATNASGGGGGAGAVGGNQTSGLYGGLGGAGLNTWSSWLTAANLPFTYVANGGSGANQNGYGAAAGNATGGAGQGVNGTAFSGGGGGGTRENGTKGNGGSGIVIVRYLKA